MSNKPKTPNLFDPKILFPAARAAFVKLDPRQLVRNPVIFVTEAVAALVTLFFVLDVATDGGSLLFSGQIAAWLWFTVLFATFAEAVAEGAARRRPTSSAVPNRSSAPASLSPPRVGRPRKPPPPC